MEPQSRLAAVRKGALLMAAAVVLLALLEGLVGIGLTAQQFVKELKRPRFRQYMFDQEIGWAYRPNVWIKDAFARGIGFKTNSQGFRGSPELARTVPPGKKRLLCSGDSFTAGIGVKDDETWCSQVALREPRLETANLGVGGYGLDQMYLRYRRYKDSLDHQVHVVAVIGDDFFRIRSPKFLDRAKPVLEIRNGLLTIGNFPLPSPTLSSRVRNSLSTAGLQLRSVDLGIDLLERARRRLRPSAEVRHAETKRLSAAILEALQGVCRQKDCTLFLLYLPSEPECQGHAPDEGLHAFWNEEARRRGVPSLDLTEACRAIPADEKESLFIQQNERYVDKGIAGHYSARGHRFVAEHLLPRVQSILGLGRAH